jgi:hypothetical protein
MRPRRAVLFAAILLTVLFALVSAAGRSDDRPGFTVGVLRRDGVLIPFATYDGSKWSNRWSAEQATDLPIGLGDIPKDWWAGGQPQTAWTAWPASGGSQAIQARAPVALTVHCTRRVGLRTDFVAMEPPPPPDFQPYPKSGLALSGPAAVTVERIELVPPASAEAKALADRVRAEVASAETKKVRAWSQVWKHPLDDKGRAATPLALEVVARTPGLLVNSTVSYFEAVKKYPGFIQLPQNVPPSSGAAGLAQSCEYLTFAGGWVVTGPREGVTVGADLSNCNREDLVYTLPLGAIRTGGRLFWIVQASSWDFERYDVIEIRQIDVKTALSVPGGTCR